MNFKFSSVIVFFCFFIFSCASVKAPPGGPKDETPPKLIKTIPPVGSVNFDGGKVELVFSEYLKESSISKAISILPKFENEPEIVFKGEKIIINFPKNLLENQTYVISINRKLLDENGVSFSNGIQAAFSTGPEIDKGSISGVVHGEKPRSVLLWKVDNLTKSNSYFLNNPNYVMNVSDAGSYNFNYLSYGTYAMVAINESSIGLPLDSRFALVGLPWAKYFEIKNDNLNIMNVNIIIPEKSGQNKMLRAEWPFSNWIKIYFLNKIDNLTDYDFVKLFNGNIEIHPKKIFKDRLDSSILHLILEDTSDIQSLIIKTEEIVKYQNTLLDSGQVNVNLNATVDTSYLKIKYPAKDYTHDIRNDLVMPLHIDFSRIINQEKTNPVIKLLKDSLTIPIKFNWDSPLSLFVTPQKNWDQSQKYILNIFRESIKPDYGNTFADSISSINFKTSKIIRFGSVIGKIKSEFSQNLILILKEMSENKSKKIYNNVKKSGEFYFDLIPEGNYELKIFYDNDKNFRYSFGSVTLNKPAEWFFYYPDTIKVRGNWDLDLGDISVAPFIQ